MEIERQKGKQAIYIVKQKIKEIEG